MLPTSHKCAFVFVCGGGGGGVSGISPVYPSLPNLTKQPYDIPERYDQPQRQETMSEYALVDHLQISFVIQDMPIESKSRHH